MVPSMTIGSRANRPLRRARRTGALVGAPLAFLVVAALVLGSPGATASASWPSDPISWSNGLVLCQFNATSPSVAVSHNGVGGTGITVSLLSLAEITPEGSAAATADLADVTWSVANLSEDDAYYDLAYSAVAPTMGPTGGSSPIGSVELEVQFVLPYPGTPGETANEVSLWISAVNWSWQNAADHLELSFGAAPSFPASEHLNVTAAPGWLLASTYNDSGQVLEQMGANSSAEVVPSSGPTTTVAANVSLAVPSPAWAVVSVAFGSSAGTYSSLSYVARVGVVIPAQIAGIPVTDLAAVAASGALVCVGVAVVTRRVRRRPSKLIYVTEEGEP